MEQKRLFVILSALLILLGSCEHENDKVAATGEAGDSTASAVSSEFVLTLVPPTSTPESVPELALTASVEAVSSPIVLPDATHTPEHVDPQRDEEHKDTKDDGHSEGN